MKDSQRAAKKRYRAKVEVLQVELYPTDADIKDKLKTVGAKATYIKKLIREDIRRDYEKEIDNKKNIGGDSSVDFMLVGVHFHGLRGS